MDVLANLSKLPEVAYIDNPRDGRYNTEAPIIALKRGVMGYYPILLGPGCSAAVLNEGHATKAQVAAMEAGSCFGWDVPAADPDRYDADGKFKP